MCLQIPYQHHLIKFKIKSLFNLIHYKITNLFTPSLTSTRQLQTQFFVFNCNERIRKNNGCMFILNSARKKEISDSCFQVCLV